MVFDKTKAMRNAERYLAQGKIRSAISEYKDVVDNDPKDFVTMNLLGDLYSKAAEPKSAITYYTAVAEHYSKQGFSQKAIAVYNKISKLQPNSVAVSEKLADLYKTKGSVKEAKSHYVLLAESYEAKGRMNEALAMWKQIALLDPNNTEVFVTIGESYLKEGNTGEAAGAFADAGERLLKCGRQGDALAVYARAVDVDTSNAKAVNGYVSAAFAAGEGEKAVALLQSMSEANRNDRELLSALIDCHIGMGNAAEAEKTVIKLVEREPANYPKLLDLAKYYISANNFDSASRMLSMGSDHMLAGGQAEAFADAVRAVLDHKPEQLEALRLLVRFSTWQRDEAALKDSLQRMAKVAKHDNSIEDERFALTQLVLLMPQEASFAERLHQINVENGFESEASSNQFDERFFKQNGVVAEALTDLASQFETSGGADFAIVGAVIESADGTSQAFEFSQPIVDVHEVAEEAALVSAEETDNSPEGRLRKECDSIKFYIDNGYEELAQKAIEELRAEFGNVPPIAELSSYLKGPDAAVEPAASQPAAESPGMTSGLFDLGELRSELGIEEEPEQIDDSDYETKYQTAVAYQEMGLLEMAIAEFQDAAALVKPNDGSRRFFQCANLLGHCFMQNGMPKLAAKWYERALEIGDLTSDEKQALWYELGLAGEAEGDLESAEKYFEQVYAENVDFRDIGTRIRNMAVTH